MLFNSRLKLFPRKLRSKWTVLFKVIEVFPNGAVKLEDPENKITFKVNGQRLEIYLEYGQWEEDLEDDGEIIYLQDANMEPEGLGLPISP